MLPQSNPQPAKRAFELAELEEQGHGCRSYLYEQINQGHLRAVKRGRRTIVLVEDLEKWISALPYRPKGASQKRSARRK
jgi:hypothetical protein